MGLKNPWHDCETNPPRQYLRVEIKDVHKIQYIGYRYKKQYFESIGNYIIENPKVWRYIPEGSYLFNDIKQKIMGSGSVEVALNEGG